MGRKKSVVFLEKTAAVFDLPGEALAGEPRVTVSGVNSLHIENHRGLLEYSENQLVVNARGLVIKVTGRDLTVAAMSDLELVVKGKVQSVEFVE